ncbi:MAG: IclR family transcriptional regulator [Bryobacterales bacterium]|nr:IclR family transcriptional regulator [Bryobacterales bacterium]
MPKRNGSTSRSIPLNSEVASVRKALDLLTAFSVAQPKHSLSALARKCKIPKSTAHNLMQTLLGFDLVRQDPQTREYRIGPRAMELGLLFARRDELLSQARRVLRLLADETGETVKLGVLFAGDVLILAAVESAHQLHTRGDAGTRWPLHSTGLGKALLSALSGTEVEELLSRRELTAATKSTITRLPDLRQELIRIRTRGYAVDLEENEPGVCCVAAPILDPLGGVAASISVSGPRIRLDDKRLKQIGGRVAALVKKLAILRTEES